MEDYLARIKVLEEQNISSRNIGIVIADAAVANRRNNPSYYDRVADTANKESQWMLRGLERLGNGELTAEKLDEIAQTLIASVPDERAAMHITFVYDVVRFFVRNTRHESSVFEFLGENVPAAIHTVQVKPYDRKKGKAIKPEYNRIVSACRRKLEERFSIRFDND